MSYAASLLAAYPSSYGPSTLLSDELVSGSGLGPYYDSSRPYGSTGRLLSDDLAFNPVGLPTTSYRPAPFSLSSSLFPTTQTSYRVPPLRQWASDAPAQKSFNSMNDISEYSESLATASNTNTASSIARSITDNHHGGPPNLFTNYQQSYNRGVHDPNDSSNLHRIWTPTQVKKPAQTEHEKSMPIQRSVPPPVVAPRTQPPTAVRRMSSRDEDSEESKRDLTPVPAPVPPSKSQSHIQRNPTVTEIPKQQSSVDIEAWLSESKKDLPVDEKAAEQAWSVKVDQLHNVQRQREKEKAKSSRALPDLTKKVDNKPLTSKPAATTAGNSKASDHSTSFPTRHDSYFDSLFDGVFFRKPSNGNANNTLPHQNPKLTRNKPTTTSLNKTHPTIQPKPSKHIPTRKTPHYEPPSSKRVSQTITTTSWRKQLPKQYYYDSVLPYYMHNELTHREFVHKDTDERYREALHAIRQDKAEQQQKETVNSDATAKRLNYGDYVRHSTRDALLHNAVKPSPWSDFMDLKKGNLYSLSKQEKKELYYQSKSYGERVRHRNFAIHYGEETARSRQRSLLPEVDQELDPDELTPRAPMATGANSKSVSRTSKRPESASTTKTTSKTFNKPTTFGGALKSHPSSRATIRTDRSSTLRPSEEEDEDLSDFETSRRQKKQHRQQNTKNVHYSKYDNSGRNTSGTEGTENEEDGGQSVRTRNRDTDDDLFTVREEKTLESLLENSRYKKR